MVALLAETLDPDSDETIEDPDEEQLDDEQPDEAPDELVPAPRPQPESTLSPEQRRIRELENQLAVERGRKDPQAELEKPKRSKENVLIHFVGDGFTALGQIWYRGQELEFTPGSGAYQDTCDRSGRSWLELREDESTQIEKYGEVMFRPGPWPGKSYTDASSVAYEQLKPLKSGGAFAPPSEEELAKAAAAEAKRRRAAPRLPR
jgi:hypothetical protein